MYDVIKIGINIFKSIIISHNENLKNIIWGPLQCEEMFLRNYEKNIQEINK